VQFRVPFRIPVLLLCVALSSVGIALPIEKLCSSSFPGYRLALPFCFAVWSFRFH